jgi:protein-tyrosine phosphatase
MVCTANACRSPIAAAFLRRRLEGESPGVEVDSAGLLDEGRPASREAVVTARDYGVDLSAHVSRRMTSQLLAESDLVLGMGVEHVREAVALLPDVLPRAFTLKELVDRAERVGPRASGEQLSDWLARVDTGRDVAELLRIAGDLDVADPTGGPPAGYRALAEELDSVLRRLVQLAWSS